MRQKKKKLGRIETIHELSLCSRNKKPEGTGKVRQGLKEAAEGKTEKVDDLESFLNDL